MCHNNHEHSRGSPVCRNRTGKGDAGGEGSETTIQAVPEHHGSKKRSPNKIPKGMYPEKDGESTYKQQSEAVVMLIYI